MAIQPDREIKDGESFPVLKIHDTEFFVDIRGLQFVEVENPSNRISFLDLNDLGDHTEILYDQKTRNGYRGEWKEALR